MLNGINSGQKLISFITPQMPVQLHKYLLNTYNVNGIVLADTGRQKMQSAAF